MSKGKLEKRVDLVGALVVLVLAVLAGYLFRDTFNERLWVELVVVALLVVAFVVGTRICLRLIKRRRDQAQDS